MQFSQKALIYNRAQFVFGPKKLEVTIDDGCLKIGFTAPYPEIGTKRSIKSFPEKAIFYYGLALLSAAAVSYAVIAGGLPYNNVVIIVAGALMGAALCLASRYMKFEATRIPVASGHTIIVFHDDRHQAIVGEIYKRRKSEMLRLHGQVDTLNHPHLELKKFLWLKEEGVLSELEFNEARLKITGLSKNPPHNL